MLEVWPSSEESCYTLDCWGHIVKRHLMCVSEWTSDGEFVAYTCEQNKPSEMEIDRFSGASFRHLNMFNIITCPG